MGIRFRKSLNLGPLRFTLSPKGISKSLSAGPFRITKRADGKTQTTTRIPGTGFSYVATAAAPRAAPSPDAPATKPTAPRWLSILLLILVGIFIFLVIAIPSKP